MAAMAMAPQMDEFMIHMNILKANVDEKPDKSGLVVFSTEGGPSFTVETIHISCTSDAYNGSGHQYGGIIIYNREPSTKHYSGVAEWWTENNTHCKTGYLVIKDTDSKPRPQDEFPNEPGIVHGAIYRKVFGESCKGKKVIGEGFGVVNGEFTTKSGSFNAVDDGYRDSDIMENPKMAKCVKKVVESWKAARGNFTACQNYKVKDLLD